MSRTACKRRLEPRARFMWWIDRGPASRLAGDLGVGDESAYEKGGGVTANLRELGSKVPRMRSQARDLLPEKTQGKKADSSSLVSAAGAAIREFDIRQFTSAVDFAG